MKTRLELAIELGVFLVVVILFIRFYVEVTG